MTCKGLHCPGCGHGGSQVLVYGAAALAALELAEWVFARRWWILGITAAAAAVTIYAVWRLLRWADRRDAVRGSQLYAGRLTARPVLAVPRAERPAIGPARAVIVNITVTPAELAAIMRRYDGED